MLRLIAVLSASVYVAHAGELGESLFDDDEVAAEEAERLIDDDGADSVWTPPVDPNEITFGSELDFKISKDIVFDEAGNVKEGGSSDPDIAMWHVAEFNDERIIEPTDGSEKLTQALENGEPYVVKFAPPDLSRVKCNEKVEAIALILDREYHDMPQELVEKALAVLAEEGIVNTKQLGDLWEKDYDAIKIPAIIKSRLRPFRQEAREQAERAAKKVDIDSDEVQAELRDFMAARGSHTDNATAPTQQAAASDAQPVAEETEEDGTFKSLVWAIMNCPTCKGKETIGCLRTCRYGVDPLGNPTKKGSWKECLNQCVTNSWIRASFSFMLPSEPTS